MSWCSPTWQANADALSQKCCTWESAEEQDSLYVTEARSFTLSLTDVTDNNAHVVTSVSEKKA